MESQQAIGTRETARVAQSTPSETRGSFVIALARAVVTGIVSLGILPGTSDAQDRLKTMPGYERFQKMSREITNSVKPGSLSVTWKDGGKAFEYRKDGKRYRYDIAGRKL